MAKLCPQTDNWCTSDLRTIKTSFLWTINKFSKCCEKPGEKLRSTTFCAEEDLKTKWYLIMYPKGESNFENYIGIYLNLKDMDRTEVIAKYSIAIIDANKRLYKQRGTEDCFRVKGSRGWRQFISRPALENLSKQLLPNDCLSIFCEVTTLTPRKTTSGRKVSLKRSKTIINDMTDLFHNQKYSDVEIVVEGHKFRAHKLILQTRSPVFAAMFEHPMKESQQNRVIIKDIDQKIFDRVLRFIYTDVVVNEDIDSNFELLSAADKYDLKDLKSICEEYIGSELTVDNVCDILLMADKHFSEELKTRAIDFIKSNSKVMKTKGWKKVIDSSDLLKLF